MKISLARKIRLSFSTDGILNKLCAGFLPVIYLLWIFMCESSDAIGQTSALAATIFVCELCLALYFLVSFSFSFSGLKFMKTLPLTKSDIIDIAGIGLVTTAVFSFVGQIAMALLCKKPDILPYLICMDTVMIAIASLLMPFYMKTNYTKSDRSDGSEFKKKIVKSVCLIIVYFLIQAAAVGIIVYRAAFKADPAKDMVWLIAAAAVAFAVFALLLAVCRRLKISFEC